MRVVNKLGLDQYINEAGQVVRVQYPAHRGETPHVDEGTLADKDIYSYNPVLCDDCQAPLQEAPASRARTGQDVFRCPWTTKGARMVVYRDPTLLVLSCGRPKKAGVRGLPGAVMQS